MTVIHITAARVITDHLAAFDHDAILYVYTVNGVEVRGIHWSGRFDGPVSQLVNHLHELATMYRAHYVTTTETQQRRALRLIRRYLRPLGWHAEKAGEYVLLYRADTFTRAGSPLLRVLSHVLHWRLWRQMHVARFALHHTQLRLLWLIYDVHGPSDIEAGDHFKPGKQTDIARQGWPALGRWMHHDARQHPGAVQVAAADSNGDHYRPPLLNWFEAQLGARSVWQGHLPHPHQGSHGDRLIDGAWLAPVGAEEEPA